MNRFRSGLLRSFKYTIDIEIAVARARRTNQHRIVRHLDMQGIGSNQTVNGLSWNCYDRLMTYAATTLPDGTPSYDRTKLAPELAQAV